MRFGGSLKLLCGYVRVLVAQLCLTLYGPVDCSPPVSSVHGILQERILEWVAFPSPGDIHDPGIEHGSPALQTDSLPCEPPGRPRLVHINSRLDGLAFCNLLLPLEYMYSNFRFSRATAGFPGLLFSVILMFLEYAASY